MSLLLVSSPSRSPGGLFTPRLFSFSQKSQEASLLLVSSSCLSGAQEASLLLVSSLPVLRSPGGLFTPRLLFSCLKEPRRPLYSSSLFAKVKGAQETSLLLVSSLKDPGEDSSPRYVSSWDLGEDSSPRYPLSWVLRE